jgi:hypothetical protein
VVRAAAVGALVLALVAVVVTWRAASAQVAFPQGQNVVPVYEGWLPNPDGSFDLVFGYFNRNFEEELDVLVGADNTIEPGDPDQGQPTHFYPRRSRFQFHIRVPKDFGNKEMVWTLTTHGKTARAYATLKPDYAMDDIVIMNNEGAGGSGGGGNHLEGNKPPTLTVEGEKARTVTVGETVTLAAISTDDGIPKRRVIRSSGTRRPANDAKENEAAARTSGQTFVAPRIGARCCPDSASGLRVSWLVYRGPAAKAAFDPEQLEAWEDYRDGRNSPFSEGWEPPPLPADNKWVTHVTFSDPGTYVLRCLAHDGGLFTLEDITFTVKR